MDTSHFIQTISDTALLRVVQRRTGRRYGASRGGLSIGTWETTNATTSWQPICAGRIDLYSAGFVFIGTVATEQVAFIDVLSYAHMPAFNASGHVLTGAVQLVVHRHRGQPIAFVTSPAGCEVIRTGHEVWRLKELIQAESHEADLEVTKARAEVVAAWTQFLDIALDPFATVEDLEAVLAHVESSADAANSPEVQEVIERVIRACELALNR